GREGGVAGRGRGEGGLDRPRRVTDPGDRQAAPGRRQGAAGVSPEPGPGEPRGARREIVDAMNGCHRILHLSNRGAFNRREPPRRHETTKTNQIVTTCRSRMSLLPE